MEKKINKLHLFLYISYTYTVFAYFFSTGHLSDSLKSFAGQISICRTESIFVVRIHVLFSLLRFTGHLSDSFCRTKNEKMPVLSGSPAFSRTLTYIVIEQLTISLNSRDVESIDVGVSTLVVSTMFVSRNVAI